MGGRGRGESSAANIDICDEAINSTLFWAYAVMLDIIAWLLLLLMGWTDDCPCHEDDIDAAHSARGA